MSDLNFLCKSVPRQLPPKSAIYEQMPREIYDSVPALSYSIIKQWLDLESTPDEFKWWLPNRFLQPITDSLILGGALDCWKLDGPDAFAAKYAVVPKDAPRRPTAFQRGAKKPSPDTVNAIFFWDQFAKENASKTILDAEQMATVEAMANALDRSKATGPEVFSECKKVTAVHLELFAGLPWKSEFDLWNPNTEYLCDLKICRDVTEARFPTDFVNWGYYVQAAVYLTMAQRLGYEKTIFGLICVKREAPYTVKVHRFNLHNEKHAALYRVVLARIEKGAKTLVAAAENDFEPSAEWVDMALPDWAVKTQERQLQLT